MANARELGKPLPGLKALRHQRGWSQRELGARAGVTFATISYLENGRCAHWVTLSKLANALGVQPAELTLLKK